MVTAVTLLCAARLVTGCDSFGTTPAAPAEELDAGSLPSEDGGGAPADEGTGCGVTPFLDEFERASASLVGAWDRLGTDGPVGDSVAILPQSGVGGSAGLALRVTPVDAGDRTLVLVKDLPPVDCVVLGFSVRLEALRREGASGLTFAAIQDSTRAPRYLLSVSGRSSLELAEQDIGGGGGYRPLASRPLDVGTWTRVVVAMDASQVKLWVDGKPLAVSAQPALVHPPARFLRFGLESAGVASEGAVTFDRVLVR